MRSRTLFIILIIFFIGCTANINIVQLETKKSKEEVESPLIDNGTKNDLSLPSF